MFKKPGFLSEHLGVTSTVARSQKPLGCVPIIFGGAEGKTISVPKYLQTIQKDIKTGQTKIKHNKKGQKCRSNNKHEKLCCRSHPLITTLPSHQATSHVGAFPTHSPPTPPAPEEEVQHHFGRGVKIKPCQEWSEKLSPSPCPALAQGSCPAPPNLSLHG